MTSERKYDSSNRFLLSGLYVLSLNANALVELGCPAGREEEQNALIQHMVQTYRQTNNLPTKCKAG